MKPVVFIITKLELGGAQKVCLKLFDELGKKGKVFLISGLGGILSKEYNNKKNVFLLKSFEREVLNPLSEIKNFINLVKLLKQLRKENQNLIVHTHSTKAGLLGRWAAFFAGIKNRFHTVHGFGFHAHQNIIFWAINYVAELFTSLITTTYICVCQEDIKTGSKLIPKFEKKSKLIRAAVENEKFIAAKKSKEPSTNYIFGTVSCLKPQKNIFDLLEAFKETRKEIDCKLEIIGDGVLKEPVEYWINKNNLGNSIKLWGWQDNVENIMCNWNCFALSSLWEGLPCSIIEAQLLGLPVIAYDVGGIKEVVKSGKNGFLVKPGNIEDLKNYMLTLALKKEPSKQKSLYLSQFYASTMVKKHLEIFSTKS